MSTKQKAEEILQLLSLKEKINLLHGNFLSGGIPRLGIPQLLCADGPLGIRKSVEFADDSATNDEVEANTALQGGDVTPTALPATIGLAATFNIDSAREYGALLGREAKFFGINVLFGPGLNVMRDPRCGRNYEYMGEDPILTAEIGCGYIEGLQSYGVAACAKHYYANDEEPVRHFTSSNLDDAVGHEIYLRPFLIAARKVNLWTMMTGNNLVNGLHVSENREALSIMRDEEDWDGVIFTDWRAAYEPQKAAEAGLDMTTGFCSYVYGDGRLLELVKTGTIPESLIDEKALHVLLLYLRTGLINPPEKMRRGELATKKHRNIARNLTAESMVLLKNSGSILPMKNGDIQNILITGPGARKVLTGRGSSNVYNGQADTHSITPFAGIKDAYPDANVTFEEDIGNAVDLSVKMDVIIFCASTDAPAEGKDMGKITLPDSQSEHIKRLGKANPNLVVVVQCGNAVSMDTWIDSTRAVLISWLGGLMLGTALGDILTGKTNPSGKLPCTIGKSIDDYPCEKLKLWPAKLILDSPPSSPGATAEDRKIIHAYDANYDEGFFIGYRWFEKQKIVPLFPFGFGLSYTTFELSNPTVSVLDNKLNIDCDITNTGGRFGGEVVQVYIRSPLSERERPIKELKGFAKVFLNPEEKQPVTIKISFKELNCYDSNKSEWFFPKGKYEVQIGTSSIDIVFRERIIL